ncbi:MAG: Tn3 family transposase [Rickettsiales bacterium]|nr:Tn3 family transposase [Rickettsiales bacterium]
MNASNEVMKYTQKLSIFEKYNLADYGVHASVDGQKLETKYNIIKSRFSKKYYGKGKGVSALTMSANHLPLATKIIGSNDHESHSLYDIVSSNTSDIEVTAISGDMHSVNRVNFALLYMFGYQFMPRFTNLDKRAAANLVCFDDPEKYADYMIRPNTKVNKKLIKKEWDNLLRIFATLGLKKITQTNIVKKLSSHKSDDTIKALIEFDKIIMSIYMLHYIDNEDTRKVVFKSLNRGESYHQLRSAIAKVSGRKLAGRSEIEIINNNECARLMTICIIFYNASILSGIYDYYKSKNKEEECNKIIRLSPVAWQHINLIGRYEFKNNTQTLDLQGIIEMLINDSEIGLALES